jgi:bifunctional non-homologous end joining protein LigD
VLRFRVANGEGKRVEHTLPVGLVAKFPKESDAWARWVRPQLVARIEFLEWTASDHLRHSKFAGLREDKDARTVIKEHGGEG